MQYNFITNKLVPAQRAATDLLKAYFASNVSSALQQPGTKLNTGDSRMLISTPTYSIPSPASSSSALVVQLFSWASTSGQDKSRSASTVGNASSKLNSTSLNSLVAALSRLFSSTTDLQVPVQLRIVRLHHPYLNSSILAQFLALNASKYGFARLRQYVLNSIPLSTIWSSEARRSTQNTNTNSVLGVRVQVSGLLTTQRMAPRKTVSTVSAGTFHGPGTHVDYSSHTSKSALGSYTVKVWLCTC